MVKRLSVERRPSRAMTVCARNYRGPQRWDDEWISSVLDLTDMDGRLLSG